MRLPKSILAAGFVLLVSTGLSACATVPPPSAPSTLFVANKFGNTLSRIDLASGEEVQRVPACENPHELATSPDGRHVALACYGGTRIDIFTTDALEKVASIDLGANARPHGIVWHESGAIYATAEGKQELARIIRPLEPDHAITFYRTFKAGSHMVAVAPDESAAWTTDLGSKTVTRIDLREGRASLSREVGIEPEGIALSPDGRMLWVSARGSDKAFALDPATLAIRETVETGAFPLRLAIRPQGDVAITSNLRDGSLTVIDLATARPVRTIAVSSAAEAEERFQVTLLWSDDGRRIYVAETKSDTIAEVDYASGAVLRRLRAGDGGDGLAILP